jgi:hypothetical protein
MMQSKLSPGSALAWLRLAMSVACRLAASISTTELVVTRPVPKTCRIPRVTNLEHRSSYGFPVLAQELFDIGADYGVPRSMP